MTPTEDSANQPRFGFGALMFGLGTVFGLFVAVSCGLALVVLVGMQPAIDSIRSAENSSAPDAHIELVVGDDGCHVVRGEVEGSTTVISLTWVFKDMDGYTVLERDADGEYETKYFRGGQYRVYVKAWYDGGYHKISEEVVVDCPDGP